MNKENLKELFKELVQNGEIEFLIHTEGDSFENSIKTELDIRVDGEVIYTQDSITYL